MNIKEIRAKYPQYNDLSDQQLADSLHAKFYADLPKEQFYSKVGLIQEQPKPEGSMLGNLAKGAISGLEQAGLGIYQTAADLGASFGPAKSLLTKIRPDLKNEIESLTPQDISGILAEKATQKRQQAEKEGIAYNVGEFVGKVAPYLGVGGTSLTGLAAGGAAASGTQLLEKPEERLAETGEGALTGVIAGKAIQGIGKAASELGKTGENIAKGVAARPLDKLDQIAATIKQKSSGLYEAMRNSGATLTPKASGKIVTNLEKTIAESGKLNPRLHGDTLSVINDLKEAAKSGKLDLEELDQFRQLLGDVVSKNTDIAGKANPDAMKATQAISKLDDIVENSKPEFLIGSGNKEGVKYLNEARQEWKRYRKFDTVTNILRKADGDPNRIKAGLANFVNKPKNLRGFTLEEKNALKEAATNTTSEKLLKSFGKLGFDVGGSMTPGNTTLPVIETLMAASGVSGAGSAVIGGTIARQAQKLSAKGKVDDVLKLIEGLEPSAKIEAIKSLPKNKQLEILTKVLTRGAAISAAQNI